MPKVCLNWEEVQIQTAWGEWIEGMAAWRLFVTLTMRDRERKSDGRKYSPGLYAVKEMVAAFNVRLRLYSSEVETCTVYELQRGRDVWHSHSLVSGPFERGLAEAIKGLRVWAWEQWGFNRIVEYQPKVGASMYIGKYLVKEGGDVEFSPGLARGEYRC